jgi:hypothetical protein
MAPAHGRLHLGGAGASRDASEGLVEASDPFLELTGSGRSEPTSSGAGGSGSASAGGCGSRGSDFRARLGGIGLHVHREWCIAHDVRVRCPGSLFFIGIGARFLVFAGSLRHRSILGAAGSAGQGACAVGTEPRWGRNPQDPANPPERRLRARGGVRACFGSSATATTRAGTFVSMPSRSAPTSKPT